MHFAPGFRSQNHFLLTSSHQVCLIIEKKNRKFLVKFENFEVLKLREIHFAVGFRSKS